MINIAVFASGSGTNAENLINYFNNTTDIRVSAVLCNNPKAYVITRAAKLGVPCHLFSKGEWERVDELLSHYNIDYIVLAGFLLQVPEPLIESFPDRIINIHPALLPNYGGKGMYGMNVHNAVIAAKEKESGITIHLVDKHYDHGATLFQAKCSLTEEDTPDTLAAKIHELEQKYFPAVVMQHILCPLLSPEVVERQNEKNVELYKQMVCPKDSAKDQK